MEQPLLVVVCMQLSISNKFFNDVNCPNPTNEALLKKSKLKSDVYTVQLCFIAQFIYMTILLNFADI